MKCTYELWRFGRASGFLWHLERWGALAVLLAWLFYVFVAKNMMDYAQAGQLQMIDLLFGLPILVALGLVGAIIWMGLVRTVSCLLNQLHPQTSTEAQHET